MLYALRTNHSSWINQYSMMPQPFVQGDSWNTLLTSQVCNKCLEYLTNSSTYYIICIIVTRELHIAITTTGNLVCSNTTYHD